MLVVLLGALSRSSPRARRAASLQLRSTSGRCRPRRPQLALTDGLTGLGNHRHFHDRLQAEKLERRRSQRCAAHRVPPRRRRFLKRSTTRADTSRRPAPRAGGKSTLRHGGEASGSAATSSHCSCRTLYGVRSAEDSDRPRRPLTQAPSILLAPFFRLPRSSPRPSTLEPGLCRAPCTARGSPPDRLASKPPTRAGCSRACAFGRGSRFVSAVSSASISTGRVRRGSITSST